MAVRLENLSQLSFRAIITGQKESFRSRSSSEFDIFDVGRREYLLPPFPSRRLPPWEERPPAEIAIKEAIKKGSRAVVLDVGCGAGYWLKAQKEQYGEKFDGYGISAADYRGVAQKALVVSEEEVEIRGKRSPILKTPDGRVTCLGWDHLLEKPDIPESHYSQGDVHDLLRQFPTEKFDVVVSYQAFRYFYDPLRVLKGVYRVLKKGGFAFLESCVPQVFDPDGGQLSLPELGRIFGKNEYTVFVGGYSAYDHLREGLSLQKREKPRLTLPVSYREIIYDKGSRSFKLTYQFAEK